MDSQRNTDPGAPSQSGYSQPIQVQHKNDAVYKMSHSYRGVARIFNHRHFDSKFLKERVGTEFDRDALKNVLEKLQFQVEVYNDYNWSQIQECLKSVAKMDHSKHDCLLIAVLTHGDSHGRLYAKDDEYHTHQLIKPFSGENCLSLVGKPKLFLIQACRGKCIDQGAQVTTQPDEGSGNETIFYSLPVMADILIMHASAEGYIAWRNTKKGSFFIQTLVQMLEEYHETRDLLGILTLVNQKVANDFQTTSEEYPEYHTIKEMCCITSMLTKLLYFTTDQKKMSMARTQGTDEGGLI